MLYADDVGIVSLSSQGLEMMMTVIVTACPAFGLTVSDDKMEIVCLQTKDGRGGSFAKNVADEEYDRMIEFAYLDGGINKNKDLGIEKTRRLQRAWACFRRYKMKKSIISRVRAYV